MKCPSCGAEIISGRVCEHCGASIDTKMLREQEILNKAGCPKCGSTNVTFNRENQGEVRGKNSKRVIHYTVGVCKDCGYTWRSDINPNASNSKTWLWVLGWILFFPIPLTILINRSKNLSPKTKKGIIAGVWGLIAFIALLEIVVAIIAIVSGDVDTTSSADSDSVTAQTYTLVGEDIGKYGKKVTLNEDSDMPVDKYIYKLPAGKYIVTTTTDKAAQFSVVKDEVIIEDVESNYPENFQYVGDPYMLTAGDDDFNGHAKKSVIVTLGEDESFLLIGTDTFIFDEVIE